MYNEPRPVETLTRGLRAPLGNPVSATECSEVQPSMIAREMQELDQARAELQEEVERLTKNLTPILTDRVQPPGKEAPSPQAPLSQLGESIRRNRLDIQNSVRLIRQLRHDCEV